MKEPFIFLAILFLVFFILLAFSSQVFATAVYRFQFHPEYMGPGNYSERIRWWACIGGGAGSNLELCTLQACNIDLARNPDPLISVPADCPSAQNPNLPTVGSWEVRNGIEGCYIYDCSGGWETTDKDGNPFNCLPLEALASQADCVAHGGVWAATGFATCSSGLRCATTNIDLLNPLAAGNEQACVQAGGYWDTITDTCFGYDRSIINVDIGGSTTSNKCNVIGERACMLRIRSRTFAGATPNPPLVLVYFNITQGPNPPSNITESRADPCGPLSLNNYLVRFRWDYTHNVPKNLNNYQIRINNINSFPTNPNGDPIWDGNEFRCAGSICSVDYSSTSGQTIVFDTHSYNADWRQWLHGGRWGQQLYWTVRARDNDDYWSQWSPVKTTNHLPPNPYPWVDFDWSPLGVSEGAKQVTPAGIEIKIDPFFPPFDGRIRSHVFSSAFNYTKLFTAWTPGDLVVSRGWLFNWNFFRWDDPVWTQLDNADVILDTYDDSNHKLIIMFDQSGEYKIKLEVTDNISEDPFINPIIPDPMMCDKEWSPIRIIWQTPKYREVAPR